MLATKYSLMLQDVHFPQTLECDGGLFFRVLIRERRWRFVVKSPRPQTKHSFYFCDSNATLFYLKFRHVVDVT